MSFETWQSEFYPVPASNVTKEEACAHSLRKWIGLRPENLNKHNVEVRSINFGEDYVCNIGFEVGISDPCFILEINANSCALCLHYLHQSNLPIKCFNCPLYEVRGNVACDNPTSDEFNSGQSSPWARRNDDVEPMISWLEKALALVQAKAMKKENDNAIQS